MNKAWRNGVQGLAYKSDRGERFCDGGEELQLACLENEAHLKDSQVLEIYSDPLTTTRCVPRVYLHCAKPPDLELATLLFLFVRIGSLAD